jgi:acetyltransferase-like isoleucine patch superfamily enzyme
MGYILNPKRKLQKGFKAWMKFIFMRPLQNLGNYLGFQNIDYSYVNGDVKRLIVGEGCSTMNTLFNTVSGKIAIGDNTIFGHNCMVLTGRHRFYRGRRAKLVPNSEHFRETPESGFDIEIGTGCFIGSGAIIIAPVKVGDNVIIGGGSIVTKDLPDGCFAAGIPAKAISYHTTQ